MTDQQPAHVGWWALVDEVPTFPSPADYYSVHRFAIWLRAEGRTVVVISPGGVVQIEPAY